MTHLHVNGKWLAQRLTGTQRYAGEIVRAIIEAGGTDLTVHLPAGASAPPWMDHPHVVIRTAPVKGIVFEQLYLPVVTAGKMLLSFAGPAPLLKKRQLVTMHDATPFRHSETFRRAFVWFYFLSYLLLGRSADRIVTVSHFSARELDDVLGIPAERFVVAGCAADTLTTLEPTRPPLDGLTGPFYLVVGTLARHKNLTGPMRAVAESGRTVVVVGASGDQQVFSQASPLSGAVIAGHLSDAELAWLYRNAQALIFPSKYEGFGLPPLEAQSLGCPVVSSNAASLPEIAGDGALFFEPDDQAALLAALDRLESEPGLAAELRSRGLENATRYSWQSSARTILASLRTAGAPQPSSL